MSSLRGGSTRRRDFLALVPEASGAEERYSAVWDMLDADDTDGALHAIDGLLAKDTQNEKYRYTRALIYARTEAWQAALADYSAYIGLTGAPVGAALANAHYGRALCHAKLGAPARALADLLQCIAVGPRDEQATDADASHVPKAIVAKCLLLRQQPTLRPEPTPPDGADGADGASADAGMRESLEGPVWLARATSVEAVLARCRADGRTPLFLDRTSERVVDTYFTYQDATVIQAKSLVLDAAAGGGLSAVRGKLRRSLVHALRWGHTLVVRMDNSAADFATKYCDDDHFPLAIFDASRTPSGTNVVGSAIFGRILRPEDTAETPGSLHVPDSFAVCVTSTYAEDTHASLLADALPLGLLQPVAVYEPRHFSGAAAGVAAPLGAPKAQQLQGDRTTLFLQS